MNLNLIYDSSVNTAPSGFTSALNDLVSFFQSTFQDSVTVNIAIGYGEIGGQALDAGALGESGAFYNIFSYAQLRSAFASDVKSADDASAVASLPTDAPVDGNFWVTRGEAKALALINPASTKLDGYVGFNSSANIFDYDTSNGVSKGQYDFYAVAAHEISEIMGRQLMDGGGSGTSYEPMDLFHYAGPENRIFVGYQAGYFSPDDGNTDLGDFNTNQGGDLGDWASSVGRDAFRAFSGSGVVNAITANDIRVMDVLGWDLAGAAPPTNTDTTPPLLVATSPADNAGNVAVAANIVLTFNENVQAGSGTIDIHRASDGSLAASIAVTDASQVSISGATVTMNPQSDLAQGTHYYVTLGSGVIADTAGNAFAGLSSSADLDFTTTAPDTTPPALVATSPAANASQVAPGAYIALTFNESVQAGSGNIVIHASAGGAAVATIAAGDSSQVIFSGNTVTIDPASDLALGTGYYVTLAPGVIADSAGNPFAGISSPAALNFTTAAVDHRVASDFDHSGTSDVLWRNDNGAVVLWRSSPGSVNFADQDLGVYSSAWHIEQAADFDGDGKADVLWRNDNGAVDLWRSNPGSVTFADQDLGVYSSAWHVGQVADFNGDGKADVLWRNDNGAVDLWRSNPGSVTFTDQDLGVYSSAWHIEQAADFDGDGKADVLWRNDNGAVDLWRSNPSSVTFTDQDLGVYSSAWHVGQVADFNGDGKADVLWRNDNGAVDLWRSNPGSVTFTDQDLGVYSSAWHVGQVADFNGDGKADVLWRNDNGAVDLWESNPGPLTFTDQDLGVYSSHWHILVT